MAFQKLSEEDKKLKIGDTKEVNDRTWTLKKIAGSGNYGEFDKQGAFSAGIEKIDEKMNAVLSNPKDLTKLLMSLNVITESSRMTPLSSGRVKTPIGQITTGITKGIIQGKQIETAETAAKAKLFKSKQKSARFLKTGLELADDKWIMDYMGAYDNSEKRANQVNLRYNLIFGVKDDLPTGAVENIISPIRKLAAGFFGEEGDALDSFNNTLDKFVSGDITGLTNTQIVQFQDEFKAITMEQVIQDAKNLYPVSEADVQRLLDAAGDVGTYSAALKNLVSIQKATSQSNLYFEEGINQYYQLNDNNTRGPVRFVGANNEIITSTDFRDFARQYADYKMGLDVKDILKDENISRVYQKHEMITGEKININKLSNFDKLFTLYSINLMDKNLVNLQEIDERSQYAYLTEQKKLTEDKIKEIQEGITLD